jgi:hypothetical protein
MAWSPTESGVYLPLSGVFSGAVISSTGVTIPYTALESFGVDAPKNSGDFREFVYSVVDKAYSRLATLDTELSAGGSGIENFTITRSVDSSNFLSGTVTKSYTITSVLSVKGATYDVAEE